MMRLAVTLARAGGWSRMVLVGSCTAVVCALLLVLVTLARLPMDPEEILSDLVADPSIRGGTAFAIALLTLPPLLLLHQAVRLGSSARERRLAALRVAGATPGDVRRLGAFEVGIPALAGSVAGIALFWLLRLVLGRDSLTYVSSSSGDDYVSVTSLKLVPTSVLPQWWEIVLVVIATTLVGLFVGARASRAVIVTPLGVSRRQSAAPPRPWGLLVLAVAGLAAPFALAVDDDMPGIALIALAVLALISLAPWAAYRAGRFVASRTASPAVLLAARRLVADPRPAGRAAAAVGAIALIAGGGAVTAVDIVLTDNADAFYVIPLLMGAAALLVALLVVTGTLAVHSVESLLDRKRSVASLVALGMPLSELESAQRWEARLVAMPIAAAGALLGSGMLIALILQEGFSSLLPVLAALTGAVITLALVWLAISVAVRLTRPWTVRAAAAGNLRTE